jgi:hypothetical protein
LLDNPAITATAVSEIAALSNTTFLVLERDGKFPPDAYKKLFKVDISAATDVGPNSTVAGSIYNAASGGLLLAGQSLEVLVKGQDAADSQTTFESNGIHPGTKTLHTDIAALLNALDSSGRFFSHDKLEGLAVANAGATLLVSNDSDFGIDGLSNSVPPFQLHAKRSPVTGEQDDGEILAIDAIRSTATVTIEVVDTTAPETFIDSMPVNPSTSTAATFTFRGNDGGGSGVVRFECSLDNAPFSACTSPVTLAALGIGNHSFAVRAVDAANNADASPAAFAWVIVPDNPASIVGSISSKSGPVNGRAWTLTLNNDGIVTAVNAQILGFTLTQTFGAACTPVVAGGFPIALGTIAPGTSANASITIDFTGCVSTARFTLAAPFSANAGAFKGSIVRYNQFQ